MERKWYLDLWLLVTSPFKRGIPEIVEFGTIQRGFAATVAMIVITLVFFCYYRFGISLCV